MTEIDSSTVDASLVTDGLEHIRDEYLGNQRSKVEAFLTACYVSGVELWESHRLRINEQITEAGGVARIHTHLTDYTNHVECKNGDDVYLSSILKTPPVPLALPDGAPTFSLLNTVQNAYLRLSFGGNLAPSIHAFSTHHDLDGARLLFSKDIESILSGEYRPTQIGISETVITGREGHKKKVASGHRYQVIGRLWGAKLREEFAPDPYKDPEAYAAWRAEEPIPQLDISFSATQEPVRSDYVKWEPELPFHDKQSTYFSHSGGYSRFSLEGAQKVMRFGGLLNMLWKLEFGSDMPVPTDTVFMPEQRALPAGS